MYISRLILNPRSRRAQREIAEPYQMHRTIMGAFPEKLPENERVLFRLEAGRRGDGPPALLVQSQAQPDWSVLAGDKAYLLPLDTANPWVKSFEPVFEPGQRLLFRLCANPTVKRDGKRHALYKEDDQRQWLSRKADNGGFRLESLRLQDAGMVSGSLYRKNERHNLRLAVVQFNGLLQVMDPEGFCQTLKSGIGSGKGLGCGMLSLARAG